MLGNFQRSHFTLQLFAETSAVRNEDVFLKLETRWISVSGLLLLTIVLGKCECCCCYWHVQSFSGNFKKIKVTLHMILDLCFNK